LEEKLSFLRRLQIAACISLPFLASLDFPGKKVLCICLTRHYFSRKQLSAQVLFFSQPSGELQSKLQSFLAGSLAIGKANFSHQQ